MISPFGWLSPRLVSEFSKFLGFTPRVAAVTHARGSRSRTQMSKRRRVASASSTRRRVASASSTRRRAASPSPGTHSRYSCGTDSSAEQEPMGDLGPFTSGGPTTALVDDALLGDAVTEDRRSCSSCGPSCKARICLTVPVHGSGRCPIGAFGAAAAAAAAAAGRVSATGWSAAARARRVAPSMPAGTETSAGVTGTGDDCCSGDSGAGSAGAGVGATVRSRAGAEP